jgi:hypothetical protein
LYNKCGNRHGATLKIIKEDGNYMFRRPKRLKIEVVAPKEEEEEEYGLNYSPRLTRTILTFIGRSFISRLMCRKYTRPVAKTYLCQCYHFSLIAIFVSVQPVKVKLSLYRPGQGSKRLSAQNLWTVGT